MTGRRTFKIVLTFTAWPYAGRQVVALSSRAVDLSAAIAEALWSKWAAHRRGDHAEQTHERGRILAIKLPSAATSSLL
jgi:hypothetical protein